MLKHICALSFIWFLMAISTMAHNPPVLDTSGLPLRTGVEYYILPAATDTAGGLTLVDRNESCPSYVGQEPLAPVVSQGLPVTFTPFVAGETIIRESMSFRIAFSAASTCVRNTAWTVGEQNQEKTRRYIVAGEGGLFRIGRDGNNRYNLAFCPVDTCELCRFWCGTAGILIENDKRLLVLDGPGFPFRFRRVNSFSI